VLALDGFPARPVPDGAELAPARGLAPAPAGPAAAGLGLGSSSDEPVLQAAPGPEREPEDGPAPPVPTSLSQSLSQRARTLARDLGQAGRYMTQGLRLMVGLPDYDAYLNHMERTHPGQPVMSYEAFFRERQDARYSGKLGKCC